MVAFDRLRVEARARVIWLKECGTFCRRSGKVQGTLLVTEANGIIHRKQDISSPSAVKHTALIPSRVQQEKLTTKIDDYGIGPLVLIVILLLVVIVIVVGGDKVGLWTITMQILVWDVCRMIPTRTAVDAPKYRNRRLFGRDTI